MLPLGLFENSIFGTEITVATFGKTGQLFISTSCHTAGNRTLGGFNCNVVEAGSQITQLICLHLKIVYEGIYLTKLQVGLAQN